MFHFSKDILPYNNNHEVSSKFWSCCKLCFITDLINLVVVEVWWSCVNQLEQVAGCRLIETALRSCIANFGWQAWKRSTRHHAQCSPIRCQDEKRWKIDLFTNAKLWTRAAPQKPLEESSLPSIYWTESGGCRQPLIFGLHSSFESIGDQ